MARRHRAIRYIRGHAYMRNPGDVLVCFACGLVVGDTEIHQQWHLMREALEIDVENNRISSLDDHDRPDKWELAAIKAERERQERLAEAERERRRKEAEKARAVADVDRLEQLLAEAKQRRAELLGEAPDPAEEVKTDAQDR
jgi:hypothetical protein